MRSYNLFRLKSGEGLYCAVPESHAVPRFVSGSRWSFGGKIEEHSTVTPGFDGKAAATSVRFNGFYLFQAFDRPAH
ncbi:hypothetical protein HCU64_22070 [Methylobacterium sp. C25]|uniref:hypothetical protein n=1 Tax=Methylobacterium sp. C25 TaxID=2721622 RepID=UPI001F160024|nr:hypothetical protein [Methylobacterium sp. C25]MCE4226438.1 hypothetical protein [Methylobacterium sp. C25]